MYVLKERFTNNYDCLRIFAALCIAFTHSFNLLLKNDTEPLVRLSNGRFDFSFIGLSIFFSISGYLIVKSALKSSSLLNYIWKRFLRIQPLLIIVCVLSIFLLGPLFTQLDLHAYFADPSSYTYLRNIFPATGIQFVLPGVFKHNPAEAGVNGSLWTLIVEERLYIFVMLLIVVKENMRKFFVLFVLVLNLVFMLQNSFLHSAALHYFEEQHIFYALIFLNAGSFELLNTDFKKMASVKLLSISFIILLVLTYFSFLYVLLVLFLPFFILSLAQVRGITNKAAVFGDFTYGLYLFAFPVQQMLIELLAPHGNPWALFLETLIIIIPLAVLSWHFVEKRFLAMKTIIT